MTEVKNPMPKMGDSIAEKIPMTRNSHWYEIISVRSKTEVLASYRSSYELASYWDEDGFVVNEHESMLGRIKVFTLRRNGKWMEKGKRQKDLNDKTAQLVVSRVL